MPANTQEKIRLSLDVSPELNDVIEKLADGGSKSEVLRKAIALMRVASEAHKNGKKFGIAKDSASLETEIVGI